jgi:hypothetical protein
MKERGMLFSKPMVLALLDGTKTQTRRIVKPQPSNVINNLFIWKDNATPQDELLSLCPYGKPGDRLWVRETFAEVGNVDPGYLIYRASDYMEQVRKYRFDTFLPESKVRWTPSIHMPRRASRIDLEITRVRVERLQDISEEDAIAEGITSDSVIVGANCNGGRHTEEHATRFFFDGCDGEGFETGVDAYRGLWESLNGAGSWDVNPWVWVVEFKRIKP